MCFCQLAKARTQSAEMSAIFRFLDLPRELRNKILGYLVGHCEILGLLNDKRRCKTLTDCRHFDDLIHGNCGDAVPRTTIAYYYEISVLYTSRQMFNEASNIFYRDNLFVKVVTNSAIMYRLFRECGFMRILKPLSEQYSPATISIDLSWYEGSEDCFFSTDPCPNLGLMIPGSELELLVLLLNRANLYKRHFLKGLRLIVRVVNTFKKSKEILEKGLRPLRGLDHIGHVSIQGDLRLVYINELESAISRVVLTKRDALLQIIRRLDMIRLARDVNPRYNLKRNVLWLKSMLDDLGTVRRIYPEFWTNSSRSVFQVFLAIMNLLILEYMADLHYKDEALFYIEMAIELTEPGQNFVEESDERTIFFFLKAILLCSTGKCQESLEFFEKVVELHQDQGGLQDELHAARSRRAEFSERVIAWIQDPFSGFREELEDRLPVQG